MALSASPFFYRSISALSLLLETKAISMPEKKAENIMVMMIPTIRFVMVVMFWSLRHALQPVGVVTVV